MTDLFTGQAALPPRARAGALSAVLHAAALTIVLVASGRVGLLPTTPPHKSGPIVTLVYAPGDVSFAKKPSSRSKMRPAPAAHTALPAVTDRQVLPTRNVAPAGFGRTGESGAGYLNEGIAQPGGLKDSVGTNEGFSPVGSVGPTDIWGGSGTVARHAEPAVPEDQPAELLSAPRPAYTEDAKRLGVTGEVWLEVRLAASGEIHVLRVLSPLGYGLDEAAVSAANRTRCRPARKGGHPVDVIATIKVTFRLS